jgi:hypothetical protein
LCLNLGCPFLVDIIKTMLALLKYHIWSSDVLLGLIDDANFDFLIKILTDVFSEELGLFLSCNLTTIYRTTS